MKAPKYSEIIPTEDEALAIAQKINYMKRIGEIQESDWIGIIPIVFIDSHQNLAYNERS